ncbi:MAG TPA: DUF3043 domain-containing protein [Acidothermaceae bacterium]
MANPGDPLGTTVAPPTKGKATPKRREAEAARKVSAIGAGGRAVRGTGKGGRLTPEQSRLRREAMRRGDDTALPLRDRGPARRYARDYVDSRRNVLGLFVPVAVPVIVLGFIFPHVTLVVRITTFALYAYILGSVFDSILMARAIRQQVAARFPNEQTKGIGLYAAMRALQFRRMRMPGTRVARGAKI